MNKDIEKQLLKMLEDDELDEFCVDPRVVEYMKNWKHICDWKGLQ